MDWMGITLLCTVLAALQYVLEEGQAEDWFESKLIAGLSFFVVFGFALFIVRELTAKVPVVNLRLFKDPVFASGAFIGALMFMMLMANMFLLPVFMQEMLGFSAMQSGMALMPRVGVMMIGFPIVGRLYGRVSTQLLIATGVLLFSFGSFIMSHLNLQSGQADILWAICIQGLGMAFLMTPLMTTAFANVPRHLMSDATGLNSLMRQIGGSIGLAVFVSLLTRNGVTGRAALSAHVVATRPEVAARLAGTEAGLMARGFDAVTAHAVGLRSLLGTVMQQSMVLAFDKLFLLAGLMFLGVLPLLYFLKTKKLEGPTEAVHLELE
jgi:DHA2 family multidrug resistance protein